MRAQIERTLVVTALGLLAARCAPTEGGDAQQEASATSALVGGTDVPDFRNNPGTVAVYHQHLENGSFVWDTRPCSGVAISRTYVLTALHCLTNNYEINRTKVIPKTSIRITDPNQVKPGAALPSSGYLAPKEIIGFPFVNGLGIDAAVVHVLNVFPPLSRPFSTRGIPTFMAGTQASLVGANIEDFSFGPKVENDDNQNNGAGTLRRATLPVSGTSPAALEFYASNARSRAQYTVGGDSGSPTFESTTLALAGVHSGSSGAGEGRVSVNIGMDWIRGWVKRVRHAPGDINRDRRADNGIGLADLVFSAVPNVGNSLTVGLSQGNGAFTQWDAPLGSDFPAWSRQAGAKTVTGDFNGDGYGDVALVGGTGWASIPTAIYTAGSQGGPFFAVNNTVSAAFAATAATAGVQPVAGDFNGDGWSDIALVGGGQTSVRTALSNTDETTGTFSIVDFAVSASFRSLIPTAGARVLSGDFDGDDVDDLALVGGQGWASIPMALAATASPNPPFQRFTNGVATDFASWSRAPGARAVVGDYNGDGRDDIALIGGQNWLSVPVAFSNGPSGDFTVTNQVVIDVPQWAQTPGVQIVSGDFDGDGRDDLALAGGQGWLSIPVAFSRGDGTFSATNVSTPLAGPAGQSGTRLVSGH